ncbi:MAG: rhodanese-like domain-containing protein, partial [Alphaproteobacteria bacterium]
MSYVNPDAVVSTEWLAEHLNDPSVKVLDGTFHLPGVPRDADAEFAAAHIPGAQRFNIDAICDPASPYPHMLPSPERFAETVGAMGIDNGTHVV